MGEINKTGSMQYRRLGKSEILVSEVSFGSHLKRYNVEDPEGRRRQIEAGIEKGINLFDIYEHSYKQFEPMSMRERPARTGNSARSAVDALLAFDSR